MNIRKKGIVIITLFIGTLILAACGGAESDSAVSEAVSSERYAESEIGAGEAFAADEAFDGEIAFDSSGAMESPANSAVAPLPQERLIIRTADLQIIVTDTEESLRLIAKMANDNGGWVVSSNAFQYDENAMTGNITVRIPSEGFDSALEALQAMAVEVQSVNTSGEDVTEEFVDLSSRLNNLEATAERVRGFLEDTENVEEALAVNQELSRLESDIELIKGRMQYLSQSASFSTINVQLTPDILAQPIEIGGWQVAGVIRDALEALIGTLQALTTFAIWFVISILPIALLIFVPLWLVVRFIRNRRKGNGDTAVSTSPPPADKS